VLTALEWCNDSKANIRTYLAACPASVPGRKVPFSEPPVFLRSEQIFSVWGSHRRVRLRSVDEREHILLEHYSHINNSKRETIIF
jgi:hypothetical protein